MKFFFASITFLLSGALASESPICEGLNREGWLGLRSAYTAEYLSNIDRAWRPYDPSQPHYSHAVLRYGAAEKVEHCRSRLGALGLEACFQNFTQFVAIRDRLERSVPFLNGNPDRIENKTSIGVKGGYAFLIEDMSYLNSHPEEVMILPPELQVPNEMAWMSAARERNAEVLGFDSGLTGRRRIVVYDRIGNWDRFLFIDADGGYTLVGMIGIDQSAGPIRNRVIFREYSPPFEDGPHRMTLKNNVQACYQCHSNGPREILPASQNLHTERLPADDPNDSLEEIARKRLAEFNRRISSYGVPNWNLELNPALFGPGFATTSRFACSKCHNGFDRMELHGFMFPDEIARKVGKEHSMPPMEHGETLDQAARERLLEEIFRDHASRFREWMNEVPCPNPDSAPSVAAPISPSSGL